MLKKIVFSGIQPTGNLTIGHYIAVLSQFKELQKKYNCFYCIADLHSITNINSFNLLNNNIFNLLAVFLACDITPENCVIFLQSSIVQHTQLYWILNCFSYIGELNRMTQFKNKINNYKKKNIGLFTYPILMAADILLYKTNFVPVGFDQVQHIELVRNIAIRINKFYSNEIFVIPNYILKKNSSKIMSLINPIKKMSKSDVNTNNVIFLLDSPHIIKKKINKSLTDSDYPPKIIYDIKNKPGISNLLNIISSLKNISISILENKFYSYNYNEFKKVVYNEIIKFIYFFQEKYFYFRKKEKLLKNILIEGKKIVSKIAKKNIKIISKYIGINIL